MFESVKDKNFAPELLNKLDKLNTETVMKNLIIVRKNFFYDKSMIEQEEEKIYVTVPDLKKALFEQNWTVDYKFIIFKYSVKIEGW